MASYLRPDTGVAAGSESQRRIGVAQNIVIPLQTEINNTLWLVFHLSFTHLNLYSPKSYTYVLKCLQKSQISPLQLQVPSEVCFLFKKKVLKKCILFQSLGRLALQKVIREVCFAKPKISHSQKLTLFSTVFWESIASEHNSKNKELLRGKKRHRCLQNVKVGPEGKQVVTTWNGHRLNSPFSFWICKCT